MFDTGGIVMLIAGCKRDFCCTIGALVLASVNFIFSVIYCFLIAVEYSESRAYRCGEFRPIPSFYFISTLAAIGELFAVIAAIVITSQALHRGGCGGGAEAVTAPEVNSDVNARNNSPRFMI